MANIERENGRESRPPGGLTKFKRHTNAYIGRPETSLHFAELDLASGESPIGYPPEYPAIRRELELSGAFVKAGSVYPKEGLDPAIGFVRERFGLSQDPYVVFSGGGSDEILERIVSWLKSSKTRIWGIGPQFPNMDVFASRTEGMVSYGTDASSLEVPFNEVIRTSMEKRRNAVSRRKDNVLCYVNNANNPTGAVAAPRVIRDLADFTESEGITLIADEVHGDPLPDSESAIKLTEDHTNIMVLRSLSKTVGLAGERIGYAVMSPEVGEEFNKVLRPYPIDGPKLLLINRIMDNSIILPHVKNALDATVEVKTRLIDALERAGIKYLPTDVRVPIITVDGEHYGFAQNLSLAVVSGEGYKYTHEDMNSNLARLSVSKGLDIDFVVSRLIAGKRVVGA